MPFCLADLDVGRGFAIVVGGRSTLGGVSKKLKIRMIYTRRLVDLAFASMFVRHCRNVVLVVQCCVEERTKVR